MDKKGLEAAAKAFDQLLFSDEPETAHMAASPYKVDVARGTVMADLERSITAYLNAADKVTGSQP